MPPGCVVRGSKWVSERERAKRRKRWRDRFRTYEVYVSGGGGRVCKGEG